MRIPPRSLYALFLAAVLLVPAQYRFFGEGLADVRVDRIVLALLLAAWVFGLFGADFGPVPRAVRRAGAPLLGLLGVATFSLLLNSPRTLPTGYFAHDLKSLLLLCVFVATYFLAAKLVRSREEIERFIALVVGLGAVAAVFAAIERFSGVNPIGTWLLALPGISRVRPDVVLERGARVRVMGTAEHPIAFGALMAILLPPALHLALSSSGRKRAAYSVASALIATGMFFSVSRSALLAAAVAFGVLLVLWPAERRVLVVLALALLLLVSVVDPGVLGALTKTMRPRWVISQEEASYSSRLGDYPLVAAIVPRQPLFGVGWAAFDAARYFYLDNQLLKLVLEVGVAGLAFAAMFFSRVAGELWHAARVSMSGASLEGALLASLVSFGVLSLLFDTFGFSQIVYLFFAFAALGVSAAAQPRTATAHVPAREESEAS